MIWIISQKSSVRVSSVVPAPEFRGEACRGREDQGSRIGVTGETVELSRLIITAQDEIRVLRECQAEPLELCQPGPHRSGRAELAPSDERRAVLSAYHRTLPD